MADIFSKDGFVSSFHKSWRNTRHFFSFVFFKNTSAAVIFAVIAFFLYTDFDLKLWEYEHRIIVDDVNSYYAYLPAAFIHGDLSFEFIHDDAEKYTKHFWVFRTEKGKYCLLTTMGMSILYLPFFLLAHLYSLLLGLNAEGFGEQYKFFMSIGTLFYLAFGLIFLRKFLLKYFKELPVALVLLVITIGTNLMHYATVEPGMSHVYNFSLIAVFIYLTYLWYKNPTIRNSIFLGLIYGLIVLVRPTNVLIIIFFILFGVNSWKSFYQRILYLLSSYRKVLIMVAFYFLVWIPQMIYWYDVSGKLLYFTYSSTEGRFFFDNPQFLNVFFSYRKGWLVYNPVILFSLIGIPFLLRKKGLILPVSVYFIMMIYLLSSWVYWWYGGGYSMRSFIDFYAVIALPMAGLAEYTFKKGLVFRIIFLLIISVLLMHAVFQTRQYYFGSIHYIGMNKEAYWHSFGKLKPDDRLYDLIDYPDYIAARAGDPNKTVPFNFQIEKKLDPLKHYENRIRSSKKYMEYIRKKAKEWNMPVDSVVKMDAEWLRNRSLEKLKSEKN